MYISKIILSIFMSSIFFMSCKDKKKIEPEPEEYFSFYADGEYFNYPQIKGLGFGGTGQTLKAWGAGTAGYIIRGYSEENSIASGAITIYIFGGQIPNQDTIILDGGPNDAVLADFKYQSSNYVIEPPLSGKVIFSQRNNNKLIGSFEFNAFHVTYENNVRIVTDSIIQITNGKFAIIPTIK